MIRDAADGLGNPVQAFYDTTEEGVQPFAPCREDDWTTILGGEDEVVMQGEMR